MKTCLFAGTFDPVTRGHADIINKLIRMRYKVIVVLGRNENKDCFFTEEERLKILKSAFKGQKRVRVINYFDYGESYTKFVEKAGAFEYFRGIRNDKDLAYEKTAEEKNKKDFPFITTKYIKSSKKYEKVSSSLIRENIKEGKDVKRFIPKKAYKTFITILKEKQKGKN